MKFFLLITSLIFFTNLCFAQNICSSTHKLFQLSSNQKAIEVTELGKGKEFIPLSRLQAVSSLFFNNLKDDKLWVKFPKERNEINQLLKEIHFENGLKSEDLTIDKISFVHIPFDMIGNLGGTKKDADGHHHIEYIYSKLKINGCQKDGIPSWKITSPSGCYFYVLQRCGNAFYFKPDSCCHIVTIRSDTSTAITLKPTSISKKIKITLCVYNNITYYSLKKHLNTQQQQQQQQSSIKRKDVYDTIQCRNPETKLIGCKEYFINENQPTVKSYTIKANIFKQIDTICKDLNIVVNYDLSIDSTDNYLINFLKDTTVKYYIPIKIQCPNDSCNVKFELGINGGIAYNSIPNIDNVAIHTKSSSAHFGGDFYFGYLINKQFQIGVDLSYLTLEYKDDALYSKPIGNFQTYNDIYLAKPIIPIQAYGKVSFGTGNLTSQVSISAGYSIVSNTQIENNETLLTTNINAKGGIVLGFGFGVEYFFGCHFGIGAGVKADYFNLSGKTQNYSLFAFPMTFGLRYKFD